MWLWHCDARFVEHALVYFAEDDDARKSRFWVVRDGRVEEEDAW